jgi:hypothetical protein
MAFHITAAPDRAIVAHPPPEHVHISATRHRIGLVSSVLGVLGVLIAAFWPLVAEWLFPIGGVLMAVSFCLLSPYLGIFQHRTKRHDQQA